MTGFPFPGDQVALTSLRHRLFEACRQGNDEKLVLWQEYQAEIKWRRKLLREKDEDQDLAVALRLACEPTAPTTEAYLAAFLNFCWLFGVVREPRDLANAGENVPFVPYPHQEDLARTLINAYFEGLTVFMEKSRTMGATWIALHLIIWLWLFVPGTTWHCGSRTESLVDGVAGGKDEDTLFGRCEIIVSSLPKFMKPMGLSLQDKNQRQENLWVNPENGNRLTGESSNANFGHSQRKTGVLIDEAARWRDQKAVIAGTRHTCRTRWFITTPHEDADAVKGLMDLPSTVVVRQQWQIHPLYTLDWYKNEQANASEEDLAQQVDISWEGGAGRTIYEDWKQVRKGDFPFEKDWGILLAGLDFGRRDGTAIEYAQFRPETGKIRFLASHYSAGNTIDFYFPFLTTRPATSGIHVYSDSERALQEMVQQWIRQNGGITLFGDPSGAQTQQVANQSVLSMLAQHGISVSTNTMMVSHDSRQTRTKLMLRNAECNIEACKTLNRAMLNYRYPDSRPGTNPANRKPVHDRWSHTATAIEFIAVNLHRIKDDRQKEPPRQARHVAAWEQRSA